MAVFGGTKRYLNLDPYELHKHLINNYVLTRKGATSIFQRDTSRDKRDIDVIRENHKFLWEEEDVPRTWEERLAKKYYDKLFKEYCICDLSKYKENKVAMRWQTAQELVFGKGQFTCAAKGCRDSADLRTWEVNFAYYEHGTKKNALVKLRLCDDCSKKLNYKNKRREIKRLKNSVKVQPGRAEAERREEAAAGEEGDKEEEEGEEDKDKDKDKDEGESSIWRGPVEHEEEASRDEEFEKYLEHLLL